MTLTASTIERSTSSTTCSVPPRSRSVTARACGQPVTSVTGSSPIFRSSTRPAVPRSSGPKFSARATIRAPLAFASSSRSERLARRIA